MTKDELEKIFIEVREELLNSRDPDVLWSRIRENAKDTEHIKVEDVIPVFAAEMQRENQEFLFKVLERILCKS